MHVLAAARDGAAARARVLIDRCAKRTTVILISTAGRLHRSSDADIRTYTHNMDWACVRGMIVRSHAFRRLVAVLCLIGATPGLAQTTTLSLSLPISIDSPIGQNIGEFGREVEARTRGALKIEFQGKDRAYEENEVVSAVASGAIQIGRASCRERVLDHV